MRYRSQAVAYPYFVVALLFFGLQIACSNSPVINISLRRDHPVDNGLPPHFQ